jgi:hypothetical protein
MLLDLLSRLRGHNPTLLLRVRLLRGSLMRLRSIVVLLHLRVALLQLRLCAVRLLSRNRGGRLGDALISHVGPV